MGIHTRSAPGSIPTFPHQVFAYREVGRSVRAGSVTARSGSDPQRNRGQLSQVGQDVTTHQRAAHQHASDRDDAVEAPLDAGLAALAQMRRRGRPCGQVAVEGDRLLLRLAPGSAGDVPELLRWLGWGHLDGVLRTRPMPVLPHQGHPGALAERHLPQALDTLADACARALMLRS